MFEIFLSAIVSHCCVCLLLRNDNSLCVPVKTLRAPKSLPSATRQDRQGHQMWMEAGAEEVMETQERGIEEKSKVQF